MATGVIKIDALSEDEGVNAIFLHHLNRSTEVHGRRCRN
jgi:hypothetical protein